MDWMEKNIKSFIKGFWLSIFFLISSSSMLLGQVPQLKVNVSDSLVLSRIYFSTDGPNWTVQGNWMRFSVAGWNGVILQSVTGKVIEIHLPNRGLKGAIPPQFERLDSLEVLDLSANKLTGAVPFEITRLSKLKVLRLNINELTSIPFEMDSLKTLRNLNLASNLFQGNIPIVLASLKNLESLRLHSNNYEGAFPRELLSLERLMVLDIHNNPKLNSLPDFTVMKSLVDLNVRDCKFDFGDIEPNMSFFPLSNRYFRQDSLYEEYTVDLNDKIAKKEPIIMNAEANGSIDVHQWYKDGVPIKDTDRIKGTNSVTLTINDPQPEDKGVYTCMVTNDNVPDLTLWRHDIYLEYIEPLLLKAENRFEIDYVEGCSPHTITITNLVEAEVVQYQIAKKGLPFTNPPIGGGLGEIGKKVTYTFREPGEYIIRQIASNLPIVSLSVRVYNPQAPNIELSTCSGNTVSVSFKPNMGSPFGRVMVDFGDGSQPKFINANEKLNYTYQRSGAYKIEAKGVFDIGTNVNCNAFSETVNVFQSLPKAEIQEIRILNNGQINLSFDGLDNNKYAIQYAAAGSSNFMAANANFTERGKAIISNLNPVGNSFCFRILSLDECGNAPTISDPFCSVRIGIVGEHKQNRITWQTPELANSFFRVFRDGQIIAEGNFPDNSYLDTDVTCNISNTYMVQLITNSGKISRSIEQVHTTRALIPQDSVYNKKILASFEGISITWANPADNPKMFYIYREEAGRRTLVDSTQNLSFTDRGLQTKSPKVCYYITYKDNCQLESQIGTPICFNTGINLAFPNAFAPNSTPPNHEFKPVGEFFGKYNIQIFNRWGELLYESQNINEGWNGTYNGQLVPQGSYVYKVSMIDLGGRRFSQSGTVLLIK